MHCKTCDVKYVCTCRAYGQQVREDTTQHAGKQGGEKETTQGDKTSTSEKTDPEGGTKEGGTREGGTKEGQTEEYCKNCDVDFLCTCIHDCVERIPRPRQTGRCSTHMHTIISWQACFWEVPLQNTRDHCLVNCEAVAT